MGFERGQHNYIQHIHIHTYIYRYVINHSMLLNCFAYNKVLIYFANYLKIKFLLRMGLFCCPVTEKGP